MDLTAQTSLPRASDAWQGAPRRAVLVALIGIAIIAVGSRVQRVPPPFGLAANGQIAYRADGDILVADPDGTHAHAVISGPSDDFAAGYTRDGTQLTFLRTVSPHEATLMIAAPDGSGVRSLLKEPLTDVPGSTRRRIVGRWPSCIRPMASASCPSSISSTARCARWT